MKDPVQRNVLLITAVIAVFAALAASYAMASDDAEAAKPLTYMSIPF